MILATIDEPQGSTLNIYIRKGPHGPPLYYAERTAANGALTKPQNDMDAEECICYLSHIANGLAYQVSKLSK